MLARTTVKVAGPTLRTLPIRAWYARRSAITRLVPFMSLGEVVAPQRRSVSATSRAVSGSLAASRMPSTARRSRSPEIEISSTPLLGTVRTDRRQFDAHL